MHKWEAIIPDLSDPQVMFMWLSTLLRHVQFVRVHIPDVASPVIGIFFHDDKRILIPHPYMIVPERMYTVILPDQCPLVQLPPVVPRPLFDPSVQMQLVQGEDMKKFVAEMFKDMKRFFHERNGQVVKNLKRFVHNQFSKYRSGTTTPESSSEFWSKVNQLMNETQSEASLSQFFPPHVDTESASDGMSLSSSSSSSVSPLQNDMYRSDQDVQTDFVEYVDNGTNPSIAISELVLEDKFSWRDLLAKSNWLETKREEDTRNMEQKKEEIKQLRLESLESSKKIRQLQEQLSRSEKNIKTLRNELKSHKKASKQPKKAEKRPSIDDFLDEIVAGSASCSKSVNERDDLREQVFALFEWKMQSTLVEVSQPGNLIQVLDHPMLHNMDNLFNLVAEEEKQIKRFEHFRAKTMLVALVVMLVVNDARRSGFPTFPAYVIPGYASDSSLALYILIPGGWSGTTPLYFSLYESKTFFDKIFRKEEKIPFMSVSVDRILSIRARSPNEFDWFDPEFQHYRFERNYFAYLVMNFNSVFDRRVASYGFTSLSPSVLVEFSYFRVGQHPEIMDTPSIFMILQHVNDPVIRQKYNFRTEMTSLDDYDDGNATRLIDYIKLDNNSCDYFERALQKLSTADAFRIVSQGVFEQYVEFIVEELIDTLRFLCSQRDIDNCTNSLLEHLPPQVFIESPSNRILFIQKHIQEMLGHDFFHVGILNVTIHNSSPKNLIADFLKRGETAMVGGTVIQIAFVRTLTGVVFYFPSTPHGRQITHRIFMRIITDQNPIPFIGHRFYTPFVQNEAGELVPNSRYVIHRATSESDHVVHVDYLSVMASDFTIAEK